MFTALFYKEWIKTRALVLFIALSLLSLMIYGLVHMEQLFRINGHMSMWSAVILKNMSVLPSFIRWFTLLTGLLLGIVQYVPEMTDKRLKLTLHLPLPETKLIFFMLGYGVTVLFATFFLSYIMLNASLSMYYTTETLQLAVWQLLPYFEGGVACYLFTAWVCIEPVWYRRIVNALASVGALYLFFMDIPPGSGRLLLPYLTVILIAGFYFPFYSAERFKDGSPE